jgi:hypothetical protein
MATARGKIFASRSKNPNDVVILSAVRSPITRSFKGGLKNAWPEDILAPVSHPLDCICVFGPSTYIYTIGDGRGAQKGQDQP